jgi:signal transduction histidine kinase
MSYFKTLKQIALLFALSCLFFGLYYFLFLLTKSTSTALVSIVLVSFVAWSKGVAAGLILSLFNILWISMVLLLIAPDLTRPYPADGFIGSAIHIVFAFVAGTFGNLSRKLRFEIEERKKAETLLKKYQSELEERVKERTRELQSAYEKLHQSEKMESIGQLAGGIAHDFKNYLTIILGYSSLLCKKLDSSSQEYTFANQIETSGKNALELTSKLLTFARKEKFSVRILDVNTMVTDVISLISKSLGKNITIKSDITPSLPKISGGSSQIQNALLNLMINARDSMENGGTLTMGTCSIDVTKEYCESNNLTCSTGLYVGITVADTGNGIPEDVLPHIFEPFYTTKKEGKGTGMGLAAVYGTVKSHKGTVVVKSEKGAGTCFTLLFPVSNETDITAESSDSESVSAA